MVRDFKKHWLLFGFLLAFAYVIEAAVTFDWAGALGYVTVPAIVGGLAIKYSGSRGSLVGGYIVASLLLSYMVGREVYDAVAINRVALFEGCLASSNNAPDVTDGDRQAYCSCITDRLAWPVSRHVSTSFLISREPEPIQSNTTLLPIVSAADAACLAQVR